MATNEERLKILMMLQEGKINAEEAAQLLGAIEDAPAARASAAALPEEDFAPRRKPRFLHVRVTDTDSNKVRVNVRVPLQLVNLGLKMGKKFSPEVEGLDPELLMQMIDSGEMGQIVDVTDEEDGEHVEVYLE